MTDNDNARNREWYAGNKSYVLRQNRKRRNKLKGLVDSPRTGLWSAAEDAIVLRDDISALEKALMLQRSYQAVGSRLYRIHRKCGER
jgi:hypothetical protein